MVAEPVPVISELAEAPVVVGNVCFAVLDDVGIAVSVFNTAVAV